MASFDSASFTELTVRTHQCDRRSIDSRSNPDNGQRNYFFEKLLLEKKNICQRKQNPDLHTSNVKAVPNGADTDGQGSYALIAWLTEIIHTFLLRFSLEMQTTRVSRLAADSSRDLAE